MAYTQEEVVTEKRAVPKERVRMEKQTVTEDETVSEEVRKERIEAEATPKAPAGAAGRSGGGARPDTAPPTLFARSKATGP